MARQTDAAVVTRVLRTELLLQKSYERCLAEGPAPVRAIARRFRGHEVEHTAALAQALEALGAPSVPVPPLELTLTAARTERERLRYLHDLEERSVADLTAATGELGDTNMVRTVLTILGCQAQHLVVLREALGRAPLG